MLFLGAGASKPFGIPTMREFTKEILEVLQGGAAKPELETILARLEEFGFKDPDIEAIMDVLTARLDPTKAKFSIGPRVIEFDQRDIDRTMEIGANITLTWIEGAIYARCAKANFKISDTYFQKFFESVPAGRISSSRGWLPMGFQHIFTTNYDLCIDKFLRRQACANGFADLGFGRTFTGEWPQGSNEWTLCKLHGSVDWYEVEGRITQLSVVPGESLYGEEIRGRMMVYPASEKYALRSPYAECLFYLRQRLRTEQFCLVVGYSFRDDPINNAFIDALRFNEHLRIFLLGPRASSHVAEVEKSLGIKIIPIDAEFGTDNAFSAVRQAGVA